MTLTDFLLARIAEDEASAKDCLAYPEAMRTYDSEVQDSYRQGWRSERASDLISRWHPARVVAECEAKRQIVETWERRWDEAENAANNPKLTVGERNSMNGMFASQATGLGEAIRFLALPYADHPDYRQEWRP